MAVIVAFLERTKMEVIVDKKSGKEFEFEKIFKKKTIDDFHKVIADIKSAPFEVLHKLKGTKCTYKAKVGEYHRIQADIIGNIIKILKFSTHENCYHRR